MTFIKRRLLGTCVLMLLAGCTGVGVDGGPVGTGISAALSGNLASVAEGTAAAVSAATNDAPLPSVRVTIDEVPASASVTDARGNFYLQGQFAGRLTLRFTAPTFSVTAPIDVPAGASIALEDVRLAPGMVQMAALRHLGFLGVVAQVDCDAGELLVDDQQASANQFLVRLSGTTLVVDGSGEPLACAAVQPSQQLVVRGTVQPTDQTIAALAIIVDPQPMEPVEFSGTVMMVNCSDSTLMISQASPASGTPGMGPGGMGPPGMSMPGMMGMGSRAHVRISSTTVIVDTTGQRLECAAVQAGHQVHCQGVIDSSVPGVIQADTLTVSTTP